MQRYLQRDIYNELINLILNHDFKAVMQLLNRMKTNYNDFIIRTSDYIEESDITGFVNSLEIYVEKLSQKKVISGNEFELFKLFFYLNRYDLASNIIENLIQESPNNLSFLESASEIYYHSGDINKAFEYAQLILKIDNNNIIALKTLCYYYSSIKKRELLLETLKDLILNNINDISIWRFCMRRLFFSSATDNKKFGTEIYENNIRKIKSPEVLLYIQKVFYKTNLKKRKQIIDKLYKKESNNIKVLLAFSKYYQDKKDYSQALYYAEKAYNLDLNNTDTNAYLFDINLRLGNINETLKHFNYLEAVEGEYLIARSKDILDFFRSADIEAYSKVINFYYRSGEIFIILDEWNKHEEYSDSNLKKLFNDIWDADYKSVSSKEISIDSEKVFSDKLFNITNSVTDRSLCRIRSLTLFTIIKALKIRMRYMTGIRRRVGDICHYSKISSLNYLVTLQESKSSKLRISNVAYMNDPSEGITFIKLLKDFYVTDKIISQLYPFYMSNNGNELVYSNTYLGSFTLSKDSLPMWSQYGDGGKGCCYIFNTNFFNGAYYPIMSVWEEDDNKDKNLNNYTLFKVQYLNSEDIKNDEEFEKEQLNDLAQCINSLEKWIKENQQIKDMVILLLDQIRFLYKDIAYKHENEIRIVISPKKDDVKLTNVSEGYVVPRLFIELDKPLLFEEIILGPKVESPSEIAPYLHISDKVNKVTKSKIKYR